MGSKGRRGGDEKRRCKEKSVKGRDRCPQSDPGGGGRGAVLGRWRTEESGARCVLDKLGWSGGCPRERPGEKEALSVLPALGGF